MAPLNLLFLLLFANRELHLAKAYLELKNPKEALYVLEKIPVNQLSDEEQYQVYLTKAQSYIESNEPVKGLEILQQLLYLDYDTKTLYEWVSYAFSKAHEPKRGAYFNKLSQGVEAGNEPLPAVAPFTPEGNPIEQTIGLQMHAMEMAIALPFLFQKGGFSPVIEAQKKVASQQEAFVKLLYNQELHLSPHCNVAPYHEISAPFSEGLHLSAVALTLLENKQLPFGQVVPIQQQAIDKFKEALNALNRLPHPTPSPEAKEAMDDLKDLENMLEDEKRQRMEKIPQNTDRVIW